MNVRRRCRRGEAHLENNILSDFNILGSPLPVRVKHGQSMSSGPCRPSLWRVGEAHEGAQLHSLTLCSAPRGSALEVRTGKDLL